MNGIERGLGEMKLISPISCCIITACSIRRIQGRICSSKQADLASIRPLEQCEGTGKVDMYGQGMNGGMTIAASSDWLWNR